MNNIQTARWLSPLLVLAAAFLVFWPGLGGGFLFDDYSNILTNPRIQIAALDLQGLKSAAHGYEPGIYGRPLATIWFAIDFYLGGKDPYVYKVSSLIAHLMTAFAVFLLVSRLLRLPATAKEAWHPWAAAAIAVFWAVHPLQVSTVLYVVQRMEILASLFILLALLAYLAGRQRQIDGRTGWPWLLAAILLTGVGMLAKESAILFPVFALALELTLLRFEARSATATRLLKLAYAALVLGGAVVFFAVIVPKYAAPESYSIRDFTMIERLLSQLRILPMHIGQILLPLPGSMPFYYDTFEKSTGWLSPWTTLGGGLLLLALLGAAWRLRIRMPLFSFGVLWFFAAHALTSNVLNLELIFEHRNYLALLGIALAAADLIRRIPMRDGQGLKIVAVVLVVVLVGALGAIRAAVWGDPLLLASDLVAKSPDSPRASSDLATLYVDMADGSPDSPFFSMGAQEFERGSRLPGSSPLPEQGLIVMAATTGAPVDPAWWDSLVHKVRTQPLGPQQTIAVTGLMDRHAEGIPIDPARLTEAYLAMLERSDWPGYTYARLADFVLVNLGDDALAEQLFVEAVKRDPDDAEFAALVMSTLIAEGHVRQAEAVRAAMIANNRAPAAESDGD